MSFWTEGELNFDAKRRMNVGGVTLPGGQLLISGPKISFIPKGEGTVYAYVTDSKGNIVKHYVNGQQVPLEIWQVEMAENEGLRDSDFGQKPFYGIRSLLDRKASRFLILNEKRELTIPQLVRESSILPA
ncbi:MAG: hypothetical protein LBE98_01330 [Puniceicoccales bacterium]|jgi:hypothetical protein|nr:hypothetical protein [Puniceicoccales bacterium]